MSDALWYAIDDALDAGRSIDDIIPRDCVGMSDTEYLQVLSVIATYSENPERRKLARKKLIKYESR